MRPGSTHARRLTWPGSGRNVGTRRLRYSNLAPSMPTAIPPMLSRPKPTTSRPWPWPRSWACAPSRPTVTVASAPCTPPPVGGSRPARSGCRHHIIRCYGHDILAAAGKGSASADRVRGAGGLLPHLGMLAETYRRGGQDEGGLQGRSGQRKPGAVEAYGHHTSSHSGILILIGNGRLLTCTLLLAI